MDNKKIISGAKEIFGKVREYRRHLHACPELSFKEENTARYIRDILDAEGIENRSIAGTGVLARIGGSGDRRKAVVLRADIDALPICERHGAEYRSRNEGVMHACGHDMHTAALLGALLLLNRSRQEFGGTVFGLFQPGEELCPGGASLVLAEKPFDGYDIQAVIGEHVEPELPTGMFGFREGKYMASSDEIRITVKGEGGHAAMPQELKDPVVAAAAIITALQQVVSRNDNPGMPTVLSIGRVIADGATNIIPDSVYMEGTFRTFDETWRAGAKTRIREIVLATAAAYGVEAQVDIRDGYPCVVNSPALTARAKELTAGLFGRDAVAELEMRPTAEDFGYYCQLYPALFYRIGVGGTTGNLSAGRLHTSAFDPDEKALEYAVAAFVNIALHITKEL